MGQKVSPILLRLGYSPFNFSLWYADEQHRPHFFYQEKELKVFFTNLLRTRGILIRSFILERSTNKLVVNLDLYFSHALSKQSKFLWARSLFREIKNRYPEVNRIRDVKSFAASHLDYCKMNYKYVGRFSKTKKNFLSKCLSKFRRKDFSLVYRNRFFFFSVLKKYRNVRVLKEDDQLLGIVKNYKNTFFKSSIVRANSNKFNRFFVLKKFRYNFKSYFFKRYYNRLIAGLSLIELNRGLCKSVQRFCGLEEVQINLCSSQLSFLSSFKLYKKKLLKELIVFQRNRDLDKYFLEVCECFYFVTKSFGYGNAYILASLVVFLLESIRKQMVIVRFLKRCLLIFFSGLFGSDIAVDGIKILIKGRFNKRRRTKKVVLQEGLISLQTIGAPIDYCQTHAVTLYGTFGIKVWISKRRII